jgi:hypothetical protein
MNELPVKRNNQFNLSRNTKLINYAWSSCRGRII